MRTLLEAMHNLKENKDYISEITKIVNKCLEAGLKEELKIYTIPCMRNYQLNFNPTADNRVIPWKFLLNEIKNSKNIGWELQDFIDSFIREANNCYNDNIKNLKESDIQGLENYSENEIKRMTIDYIKTALLYAGYSEDDLKIKDIQIYGSRNRGTAKEDSDLDIVFEYEGDFREDDLFNLLNDEEEPLMFDDIIVDLNPISAERSGDMKSFMSRSKEYDKEKLNEASNYERKFISKVMDIFSYYSFAHYYDNRSNKDQEINEKDFESLENKITVNHDYNLSSKEKKQLETIINYYLNGYNFGDYDNIIPKVVRKRLDNIIKENLHENVWNTKYVDILQKAVDEISKEIPEVTFGKVTDSKYSGPRTRVKIGNVKTTYMYYDGDFFIIGDKYQSYSGTLKEIKKYLKDYVNKYCSIKEEFINNINDEKFPDRLYHFTSLESLKNILKSNTILGMKNKQVSFTSDESYPGNGFQPISNTEVELAFDAKKMAKDYTIKRYVYNLDKSAKYDDYVNEYEWVIEGNFSNVHKYLLYVSNVMGRADQEWFDEVMENYPEVKIKKW